MSRPFIAALQHMLPYYEHTKLSIPKEGLKSIPAASWWIGKQEGETTLFLSCFKCSSVSTASEEYCVHPIGFLWPCVACRKCGTEGFRYLRGWKPLRKFTGVDDWSGRDRLIQNTRVPRAVRYVWPLQAVPVDVDRPKVSQARRG